MHAWDFSGYFSEEVRECVVVGDYQKYLLDRSEQAWLVSAAPMARPTRTAPAATLPGFPRPAKGL
jgi:hypothetical protein